ncbi:glycosyltransferase family 4 protein, partial [Alistipes sp. OttesenSCG-928-L06]|nr:glycosyltransferase family 4 protein [Alistipes sp. OttesenSCG-928-L06]
MKIVMLNTSDCQGGAAVAASRLREALVRSGVGVTMVVRDKTSDDPGVVSISNTWFRRQLNRFRFLWERLVIFTRNGFSREKLFQVSVADTGADLARMREVREADIIHLHWINQGFLSLNGLRKLLSLGKPVVWTLHDMWPVTGICHHAWACERYKTECGQCPFLGSTAQNDLSTRVFRRKQALYTANLTLVPVSRWLQGRCEASALTGRLPVVTLPNTIDTERFVPGDKAEARRRLGLPSDKKIIVMGAARIDDPVKGFSLLKQALAELSPETKAASVLVLFGRFKHPEALSEPFPVEVISLGRIGEPERLPDIYRAADVAVSSSHYETFGQTLSEAMACGCPAVSFGNSGQQDIIDHLQNGYLAQYPDSADLARGIEWALHHPVPAELSRQARKKITGCFTIEKVAQQYLD